MIWQAVIGVDKFNATRASTYYSQLNEDVYNIVHDSLSYHRDQYFYESSFFMEDASYIRLKQLNFIYKLRKPILGHVNVSVSLSFENLLTLTHYKGYDPEAAIYTDNIFSDNAIDLGAYPSPKSVFLGIDLTF